MQRRQRRCDSRRGPSNRKTLRRLSADIELPVPQDSFPRLQEVECERASEEARAACPVLVRVTEREDGWCDDAWSVSGGEYEHLNDDLADLEFHDEADYYGDDYDCDDDYYDEEDCAF